MTTFIFSMKCGASDPALKHIRTYTINNGSIQWSQIESCVMGNRKNT